MSNFNFEGVHPLYANSFIALHIFMRDNTNGITEWKAENSRLYGVFRILEIKVLGDGKYKLKLQSNRLSCGINSKKPYYPKMNLTVNEKGQSQVMSSDSCKKYYWRYVIYNACI